MLHIEFKLFFFDQNFFQSIGSVYLVSGVPPRGLDCGLISAKLGCGGETAPWTGGLFSHTNKLPNFSLASSALILVRLGGRVYNLGL
jgi:hypothetical protein